MLKIEEEIFVDIKDYDGRYKIGNKGTVIGISRSKDKRYNSKQWILKQYEDENGYMRVTLLKDKNRKTVRVHRLVAENFIENANNYPCVNHIDSNRKNNNVYNLEWVTQKQNMQWASQTGRFDNMAKLNSEKMKKNRIWESRKGGRIMSAKEMFEKLGYEFIGENDEQITYYNKGEIGLTKYEHKNTKPHLLYGTDKKIEFYKDIKSYQIFSQQLADDYEFCSMCVDMHELQAINKQVEELGWYEI